MEYGKATWKELLLEAFKKTGDNNIDELKTTLSKEELNKVFDDSYGLSEGKRFTAWSKDWVYFPVVYDGAEWVGYAPRNPCDTTTKHQGGE